MCIITKDETWVSQYEPETKRQSSEWWHISSPINQKFKSQHYLPVRSCSLFSGVWMDQFWSSNMKRVRQWTVPITAWSWRRNWGQQYWAIAENFCLKAFFFFTIMHILMWPLEMLTPSEDWDFRPCSILHGPNFALFDYHVFGYFKKTKIWKW